MKTICVKRGDIVWANLGENNVGSEQNGTRPVLIIQNDVGNLHSPTTIVALITTKKKRNLPTHVEIEKVLKDDSVVMLEQVRVIDKKRIDGYILSLSNEIMKKIDKAIKISLGL